VCLLFASFTSDKIVGCFLSSEFYREMFCHFVGDFSFLVFGGPSNCKALSCNVFGFYLNLKVVVT
jgi:hypothetical protein